MVPWSWLGAPWRMLARSESSAAVSSLRWFSLCYTVWGSWHLCKVKGPSLSDQAAQDSAGAPDRWWNQPVAFSPGALLWRPAGTLPDVQCFEHRPWRRSEEPRQVGRTKGPRQGMAAQKGRGGTGWLDHAGWLKFVYKEASLEDDT